MTELESSFAVYSTTAFSLLENPAPPEFALALEPAPAPATTPAPLADPPVSAQSPASAPTGPTGQSAAGTATAPVKESEDDDVDSQVI